MSAHLAVCKRVRDLLIGSKPPLFVYFCESYPNKFFIIPPQVRPIHALLGLGFFS